MSYAIGERVPFPAENGVSMGLTLPYLYGPLGVSEDERRNTALFGIWRRDDGRLIAMYDGAAALKAEGYSYDNRDFIARCRAEKWGLKEVEILNQPHKRTAWDPELDQPVPVTVQGKISLVIDGQFGSTGKGLISSWIGANEQIDIAVSNAAPNAGHSFFIPGDPVKKVVRHLPVAAVFNPHALVYLCAGSILEPQALLDEMREFGIARERVRVHPRAAVIAPEDVALEADRASSASRLASTQKGVGAALARKVMRSAKLASDCEALAGLIGEIDLHAYMDAGCTVLMEVPQGLGLALNSGLSYPHCTSREITVSAALADAQVHPAYLGNVMMSLRTFPIRVGHLVLEGIKVGDSGPFYPDSIETSWTALGLEEELTTVTRRVRRVASFSTMQYARAVDLLRPTHVFMNFMNQMPDAGDQERLLQACARIRPVTHVADGPSLDRVRRIDLPGRCRAPAKELPAGLPSPQALRQSAPSPRPTRL